MTPLLLAFILLTLPAPKYESPASTFARLEANSYVPPWSEPPILPGNMDRYLGRTDH